MANKRLSELNPLDSTTISGADLLLVSDVSAVESKRMTADELRKYTLNSTVSQSISSSYALTASYASSSGQWNVGSNLLWTDKNVAIGTSSASIPFTIKNSRSGIVETLVIRDALNTSTASFGVQSPLQILSDGTGEAAIRMFNVDASKTAWYQNDRINMWNALYRISFEMSGDSQIYTPYNILIGRNNPPVPFFGDAAVPQKLMVSGSVWAIGFTGSLHGIADVARTTLSNTASYLQFTPGISSGTASYAFTSSNVSGQTVYVDTNNTHRITVDSSGQVGLAGGGGLTSALNELLDVGGDVTFGSYGLPFSPTIPNIHPHACVVRLRCGFSGSNEEIAGITFSARKSNQAVNTYAKISGFIETPSSSNWSGYLSFQTVQTNMGGTPREVMRLTGTGKVGIGYGNSNPDALLSILTPDVNPSKVFSIQYSGSTPTSILNVSIVGDHSVLQLNSVDNSNISSFTPRSLTLTSPNGSALLYADDVSYLSSSYNFGLGTDNPQAKLHIVTPATDGYSIITEDQTTGNFVFAVHHYLGAPQIQLSTTDLSGQLFISPVEITSFTGSNQYTLDGTKIDIQNPTGIVHLDTSADSYIYNNNKFGIGTAMPGEKLHVQGNISASAITASIHATNDTAGTVTLSGGSVLVSTAAVRTTSKIFLTSQDGDAGNLWVGSRTNGTSFSITSSTSNTHSIAWFIIN
jgi:hypothetical protein